MLIASPEVQAEIRRLLDLGERPCVERKRHVPETCPKCGVRDLYMVAAYGMEDDIVALCRHCGEGWLDLSANLVYGKAAGYKGARAGVAAGGAGGVTRPRRRHAPHRRRPPA